jgi:4-amino-4-deoxy-L-arabinose transferase-like glycosyltransferase
MRSDRLLPILLIAFALRFLFSIPVGLNLANDAGDYYQLGVGLASGEGYVEPDNGVPSAYRPPLYPGFLAGLLLLFNFSILPVQIIQALLGALLVWVIYLITRRLFTTGAAIAAAAVVCFYPDLIIYSGLLFSETLYNFLFYAGVFLLAIMWTAWTPRTHLVLPAGVAIGLAALARTEALGIAALMFLVSLLRRKHVRDMFLLGVVAAVTVSPWIVRNAVVMDKPVLTTNSGVNFWIGNHEGASGSYDYPDEGNPLRDPELTELQRMELGFSEGFEFMAGNPGDYIRLLGKKLFKFVRPIGDLVFVQAGLPASKVLFGLSALAFELLLILSIIGMAAVKDPRRGKIVILMVVVLYALTNIIIMTMPRLRLPLVPALAVFAGAGITAIADKKTALLRPPHRRRFIVALAIIALQIVTVGINLAHRLPAYLGKLRGWEG